MEKNKSEKTEVPLATWMADNDLTDADVADHVDVRRETVWRWRTKGHLPHQRERKKIEKWAGCQIIFGGTDETD